MATTVTCPTCGKQLKSDKQPPAGVLMKCPGCEAQFRYQPPAGGLPPATTAPPPPKPAEAKASPARSAAQARQRQPAAVPQPQPKSAPGGWTGFILVTGLLFAAVAGGGYYFGKDYLPDFAGWFRRDDKKQDEDLAKRDEKEEKEWDNLFNPDQPKDDEKAERVALNQGEEEAKPAADEPERSRPKRFASGGSNDILVDPQGGNNILDVEYSPDGRLLATFDGYATLWDVKTRRGLDLTPLHWGGTAVSENGRHIAFSADGKTLVFGMSHIVAVIDLPEGRVRWHKWGLVSHGTLMISDSVRTVAILETPPDGDQNHPYLTVYDVASGKQLFRLPEPYTDFTIDLTISPDDKLLALVDGSHEKIRLFEIPSGKEFDGIKGVSPGGMMFCKDSSVLLLPTTVKGDRQIWNLSNPARPKLEFQVSTIDMPRGESRLSPDGKTLVTLPGIWDIGQRRERAKLRADARHHGAISPDSQRIAYWGAFGGPAEVVIADASNGATLTVLNPGGLTEYQTHGISCVAISPNGSEVAIGTGAGSVALRSISASTPTTGSVASSSPTGAPRELASFQFVAPDNLQAYLQDTKRDFANNVWISPDGRWLVTNGHFTTLWNLETRKQHMVLTLNDDRGSRINAPPSPSEKMFGKSGPSPMYCRGWLFHGDGKSLTAVGNNSPVYYDIVAGTHLIDGNAPRYESIKSSPDGRVAASWIERIVPPPGNPRGASEKRWELVVLDGADGKIRKSLGKFYPQHTRPFIYDPYRTISISADGRRLAAAVFDQPLSRVGTPTIKVWDWESGTELPINAGSLSQLELIEGGKSLVTVMHTRDGLVAEVYDIESGSKQYEVPFSHGHTGTIVGTAFDRRLPMFVTADEHGMILLRDLKTGDPRTRFKAHESPITAIYLSPDGKQLATAARDRTVKLWDVAKLLESK